jgi:uncharacterized Rmd1/YagE family protein
MENGLFAGRAKLSARALCLGDRLDLRAFEGTSRLAVAPLTVRAGSNGCAVLFRYGAVVLFGLDAAEELAFLRLIEPHLGARYPAAERETEEAECQFTQGREERAENGVIWLQDPRMDRLQVVADILAKCVVLSHYETAMAAAFDRIEPLALQLRQHRRRWWKSRELTAHIGSTLLIQQQMVGRVEVADKPELLWDQPDLERLYARLEDEYEIRERHLALERKVDLISRTAGTVLDLLQNQRSLRVEWYIVFLILLEILISLYDLFGRQ